MKNWLSAVWKKWDHFWFGYESYKGVALFRIVFATSAFVMYFIRFLDWESFFSKDSLVSSDLIGETFSQGVRSFFVWYPIEHTWVVSLHIIYLLALLLLALGLWSRPMALIAWITHCAFVQRNYAAVYGADLLVTCWLFYLIFTNSDRFFSLRKILFSKFCPNSNTLNTSNDSSESAGSSESNNSNTSKDMWTSLGIRLIQIQLCIVYAYAGWEKLKGDSWWDGTAVWRIFANPQTSTGDFTFFRFVPWMIPLLTYSTLFFEMYFPFLIFYKKLRYWAMAFGLAFHFGITIVMGIPFFSIYMVVGYFLFISDKEYSKFKCPIKFVRQFAHRRRQHL